ncbi:MAG: hypothetical protein COB41_00475 [Proteobacteria bacterium]|nr:MAG: hypothetical protein COB41_00475 [Pseudomonadota bacterium]
MSENSTDLSKLLEIAKTPTKEKIKPITDYSEAYQFILDFKIEQGKHEVPAYVLYTLYSEWKKKKLVSKVRFYRDFQQYFIKKKKSAGAFYLLNYSAIDLQKIVGDRVNG